MACPQPILETTSCHESVYGHSIPILLVDTSTVGITRLLEAAIGCDVGYSECLSGSRIRERVLARVAVEVSIKQH
jgi:hypothetical protein